jgi:hypothetical protein
MFSAHRGRRLVFRNGKVVWSCRLAAIFERVDSVHRFLRADLRTPDPQLLFGLMTTTVLRLSGSLGAGDGPSGNGAGMAWMAMRVDEQRFTFVVRADSGEHAMHSLCEEFEISRPIGCLWLDRYKHAGLGPSESRAGSAAQSDLDGARDRSADRGFAAEAAGLRREKVAALASARADSDSGDHGARDFLAVGEVREQGAVPLGDRAVPDERPESDVADGFQKSSGMGGAGVAGVNGEQSQPVRGRFARELVDAGGSGRTAAGGGF